jgi:hypothetical protein
VEPTMAWNIDMDITCLLMHGIRTYKIKKQTKKRKPHYRLLGYVESLKPGYFLWTR